jgi:hypothetical protein
VRQRTQCPAAPLYKTLLTNEALCPTAYSLVSCCLFYPEGNIFYPSMEENQRMYIPRLLRETGLATMPQCFKDHYPGTSCIIDCSETALQKCKNLDSRRESFSHYYAQNTIKYLVAIVPCDVHLLSIWK